MNRNGRSKQPIIEAANQALAFLVFSFTQRTQRKLLRCVRCVWMETGLHAVGVIRVDVAVLAYET